MSTARMPIRPTTPHRRNPMPAIVATVVAAVALAGCAGAPAGGTASTRTTQDDPASATAVPELVRVTGTVVSGVQDGCLLLDTGFSRYVLLGGDQAQLTQAAENEDEITVTGQANSPASSSCTGGTPLAVDKVVPAT